MSYKILIVCSGNYSSISPFVSEQVNALRTKGCIIEYFPVQGKGMFGYLKNHSKYLIKIKEFQPDVIHAHYGLSGLFACLQSKIPVVTTFHGSDINKLKPRIFSWIASRLSKANIFVSAKLMRLLNLKISNRNQIIPCGVNSSLFKTTSQENAKEKLGFDKKKKYILFSSGFDNKVKNYELCYKTLEKIKDEVELIELKNYDRNQVMLLMNACELLLMTSHSEGSPQVVKEAIATGLPVVTVDVGDIDEIFTRTSQKQKYITDKSKLHIVINELLKCNVKRNKIARNCEFYDNNFIAIKLLEVFQSIKGTGQDENLYRC
jgi:glycosyltransferase involved in cell wall biosynthesis